MVTNHWRWGIWVVLVVAVGGLLAMSWAPDRSADSLKARWAPVGSASQFVDVQGMQVHVRDEGPHTSDEPIVLLHGVGDSLHTWDGWVRELTKTRRVIRFDYPGHGLTGPYTGQWLVGGENYVMLNDAKFVVATLDALGVTQPVVLGGNSLGAQISWETAQYLRATQPKRIARLILVDSTGYAFESSSIPMAFILGRVEALSPLLENTLPRFMVASSLRDTYGDKSKVTPALVDRYLELTLREGNRRAFGLRMRVDLAASPERIKNIEQPTLLLWGGQDRLIPPSHAQRFARDIAGSKLVMFDALGHLPHQEDPLLTVAAVQTFLASK